MLLQDFKDDQTEIYCLSFEVELSKGYLKGNVKYHNLQITNNAVTLLFDHSHKEA